LFHGFGISAYKIWYKDRKKINDEILLSSAFDKCIAVEDAKTKMRKIVSLLFNEENGTGKF